MVFFYCTKVDGKLDDFLDIKHVGIFIICLTRMLDLFPWTHIFSLTKMASNSTDIKKPNINTTPCIQQSIFWSSNSLNYSALDSTRNSIARNTAAKLGLLLSLSLFFFFCHILVSSFMFIDIYIYIYIYIHDVCYSYEQIKEGQRKTVQREGIIRNCNLEKLIILIVISLLFNHCIYIFLLCPMSNKNQLRDREGKKRKKEIETHRW